MLRICTAVLCLAICECAALTQICINQGGVSGDLLNYRICNVPDIDQGRTDNGVVAGLPIEGRMYCVPTPAATTGPEFNLLGSAARGESMRLCGTSLDGNYPDFCTVNLSARIESNVVN